MTLGDWAWMAVFFALFFLLCFVSLGLCLTYLEPTVLGLPIDAPRHGVKKIIGTFLVMGSIALAGLVATLIFSLITRRFMSAATYERWVSLSEAGKSSTSPWTHTFGDFFLRCIKPDRGVIAP